MWVYDWEAWVRQLEAGCAVLEVVNGSGCIQIY